MTKNFVILLNIHANHEYVCIIVLRINIVYYHV